MPVPRHTDAVIARDDASVRQRPDGRHEVTCHDPLTGIPDERVRPDLGDGHRASGDRVASRATPSCARAPSSPRGCSPWPPRGAMTTSTSYAPRWWARWSSVRHLLDRGLPRHGRVRDALGHAVPAFAGALGARGNPAVRAPDTDELLLREIEDAAVDVLVTTGSTAPGPDNHLRSVLRDLNARWLVDGVSVTPGAQMLLARLPDGRFLVGLPGRSGGRPCRPRHARQPPHPCPARRLRSSATGAQRCSWTTPRPPTTPTTPPSCPCSSRCPPRPRRRDRCRRRDPTGLDGWARAHAIAVVPPGAGLRGDVVELLDPYGRELWT